MKLGWVEWFLDFTLMFMTFVAVEALRKLHSGGQPLLGLVLEGTFAGAIWSLLKYARRHDDSNH